ncbi:MAG TPA: translational GTPase TypA [Gammaproteobacteria bacterium]|nr:translational GTPase TypA [Gammaproteobacteria bacterium]
MIERIRNVAIIAHVDHGKTTLVDKLLAASGTLDRKNIQHERVMDSNDQEKERGITILAKNTGLNWNNYRINVVDTPGHADFGGEVERVLSMVDAVLLVVDAAEGPMPQTRFVTQKAFKQGLKPIVIVNKIDKIGADPHGAIDRIFDLFDQLGATDEQLDFPVVYCSAVNGLSGLEFDQLTESMEPIFQAIIEHCPAPDVDLDGPLQLQISALDFNAFQGVIGVGRIRRGQLKRNQPVSVVDRNGNTRTGKVLQILGYKGLERLEQEAATAGDIVCITGLDPLSISDTVCSVSLIEGLPPLIVDEPTVSMTFQVNDSPFAGRDGKYITSRNIKERLERELIHNVALRVEQGESPDQFIVSGRGELHLSVLIESMRREGFELGVSRPEVITKEVDGVKKEPYEYLVIDIEDQHQGAVMEAMGLRKADIKNLEPDGQGRLRLEYIIAARGLIGFRSMFLAMTSGTGIMSHVFDHYGPVKLGDLGNRVNGVLVSMTNGETTGYSLFSLQDRGRLMLGPGVEVYEGMLLGLHARSNDLPVNPVKGKQLTNIRAAGTDENLILTPPIKLTLESALEFIDDDELVEVTPSNIRLRKKLLKESDRKRAGRAKAAS